MERTKREQLISFLEKMLVKRGMNQSSFAGQLKKIDPESKEELHPSMLNRVMSRSNTTAFRENTLLKIAKIVLQRRNATIEELWNLIDGVEPPQPTNTRTTLRVGTGFTCWSSFILHMINEKGAFPEGIEFVFCNEIVTDPETNTEKAVPYFISKPEHIKALQDPKRNFPSSEKYLADNVERMLNSGELDCAFLLRTTFELMKFPNLPEPPILHCRTAVGHGTQMYVIRVKPADQLTEVTTNPTTIPNRNTYSIQDTIPKLDTYDERRLAFELFLSQVREKRVQTITIGNTTVNQHYKELIRRDEASQAMRKLLGNDEIKFDDPEEYKKRLADLAYQMHTTDEVQLRIDVLIVVAFEPLTNLVYHDLSHEFRRIAHELGSPSTELIYTNYNVAKMVSDKSAYCLFSQVDVIDTPDKLLKANQLLNALQDHVVKKDDSKQSGDQVVETVATALADLYFTDSDDKPTDPNSKVTRMRNALKGLTFVNHALLFVNRVTKLIRTLS